MDVILESKFSLDPFESIGDIVFESWDPENLFYIEESFEEEVLMEAINTTKETFFAKVWEIIKKGAAFIRKIVTKMINGVKRLFGMKVKTGSKCAEDAGLTMRKQITIPNAPDITAKQQQEMKDAVSSMISSMISDVQDDRITFICPGELVNMDPNDKKIAVKGKEINGAWARVVRVLSLIQDPAPLELYKDFFRKLLGRGSAVTESDIDRIYDICKEFSGRVSNLSYAKDGAAQWIPKLVNNLRKQDRLVNTIIPEQKGTGGAVKGPYKDVVITIQQLMDFQIAVDEMCELGEMFDNYVKALNVSLFDSKYKDNDKVRYVNKTYMDVLNEMAWACVELQGGLHAIANGMMGVYEVGPQYFNVVDNPKQLAAFIEEAIKTGMPGKYVVRNVYNICQPNIKGNPKLDEPIMGFGRLTLIPEGDIIYKVAINRYGIRSNKNDFIVLHAVKSIGDPQFEMLFADTITTYGEYTVNVVEKVHAGKKYEPSANKANELAERINLRFRREGVNIQIYDIKADAFGQRDGSYVILDYGYTQRITARSNEDFAKSVKKRHKRKTKKGEANDASVSILGGLKSGTDTSEEPQVDSNVAQIPGVGQIKFAR